MRTYSTPQSAYDGEITKLAIIECIVSVAIYIGLGIYFGTFKHLAWAVVVAPLMLFRTEASAEWGLKLYRQSVDRLIQCYTVNLYKLSESLNSGPLLAFLKSFYVFLYFIVFSILKSIGMAIGGTAIRIIATWYWFFRQPFYTLRNVPRNWIRQAFCTDLAHPPEIVPLEANRSKVPQFPSDIPEFAWFQWGGNLHYEHPLNYPRISTTYYLPYFFQSHCFGLCSIHLGGSYDLAESFASQNSA